MIECTPRLLEINKRSSLENSPNASCQNCGFFLVFTAISVDCKRNRHKSANLMNGLQIDIG